MDFKPPKASDAIEAIQKLIDENGDLPIALDDPDTGWTLPIGVEVQSLDGEKLIMITSAYHGEPDGCIGEYTERDSDA